MQKYVMEEHIGGNTSIKLWGYSKRLLDHRAARKNSLTETSTFTTRPAKSDDDLTGIDTINNLILPLR